MSNRMEKEKNMVKVEYSANNSGGHWWLKDKDWVALSKAGWYVEWGGLYFCHSKFSWGSDKKLKDKCKTAESCHGHRKFRSYKNMEKEEDRYMGALAHDAKKKFKSITEALLEFEKLTGANVADEGCNCCGPPHGFSWKNLETGESEYESGEGLLPYLYPEKKIPHSLREAVESD